MAHFTYLWTNECRMNCISAGWEGKPLGISAGSAFSKRNVRKGDTIYVLCVEKGLVYLVGRMKVARILSREAYDAEFRNPDLWPGDEVVIGENGTPCRFHFTIPPETLKKLRFESKKAEPLLIEDGKLVEPQSLRSVRELHWESVAELNKLLT